MRVWIPMGILVIWFAMAVLGPFAGLHPNHIELTRIIEAPGSDAWLGYDDLGRPLWDRVVAGAQTSFFVAVWVVTLSFVIGTLIGTVSGYVVRELVCELVQFKVKNKAPCYLAQRSFAATCLPFGSA